MDTNETVRDAKRIIALNVSFAVLALLSYVFVIIVVTYKRTFRQFTQRLIFYLAIAGCIRSVAFVAQIVPVDVERPDDEAVIVRDGWGGFCKFSGVLVQYAGYLQGLAVLWISLYIFVAVMFQRQLRERRHETWGILALILVPTLFAWEPFISNSYGLTGTVCWITDKTYVLWIGVVPQGLLSFISVFLLIVSVASLLRGYLQRQNRKAAQEISLLILYPQRQNRKAAQEISLLILYPLTYSTAFSVRVIGLLVGGDKTTFASVTINLIQASSVILLLSLTCIGHSVCPKLCWATMMKKDGLEKELLSHSASDRSSET